MNRADEVRTFWSAPLCRWIRHALVSLPFDRSHLSSAYKALHHSTNHIYALYVHQQQLPA